MKASILNYNWDFSNYGAVLTAFALQKLLADYLAYDNELVTCNDERKKFYRYVNNSFNVFRKKYMKCTKPLKKYFEYKNLNNNFSIFISGSDQVFRTCVARDLLDYFLLNFAEPDKKKIAIAASFGGDKEQFLNETPPAIIEKMKTALRTFDYVSVREKDGVEICKDVLGINAKWIIDPVFMLNKSEYEKLANNSNINVKNKIVSYMFNKNDQHKKMEKYLKQKYNSDIIELYNSGKTIEDWIKAIIDCKLFVTNSFHGMCFAIIFNKPFICIVNKDTGLSRYSSIFELLEIDDQCINTPLDIINNNCVFKIDYDRTNKNIEKQKQFGINFIKEALASDVKNIREKTYAKISFLESKLIETEEKLELNKLIKNRVWYLWKIIYNCYLPLILKSRIDNFRKQKNDNRIGK